MLADIVSYIRMQISASMPSAYLDLFTILFHQLLDFFHLCLFLFPHLVFNTTATPQSSHSLSGLDHLSPHSMHAIAIFALNGGFFSIHEPGAKKMIPIRFLSRVTGVLSIATEVLVESRLCAFFTVHLIAL